LRRGERTEAGVAGAEFGVHVKAAISFSNIPATIGSRGWPACLSRFDAGTDALEQFDGFVLEERELELVAKKSLSRARHPVGRAFGQPEHEAGFFRKLEDVEQHPQVLVFAVKTEEQEGFAVLHGVAQRGGQARFLAHALHRVNVFELVGDGEG